MSQVCVAGAGALACWGLAGPARGRGGRVVGHEYYVVGGCG